MDEYKKINIDSFHHRSSSAKNIKGNNLKKSTNLNITNEFTKVNTLGTTNTSGTQPIIIYKKGLNNHNNNIKQIKVSSNNNKNIYISDGGLKKKLDRYNNVGHSYSIPNKKTASMKKEKKTKKFYPTKKKLVKSSTQEKLFSQTMIGSFKRPNIPKKEKEKEKKNKKKNSQIGNNANENREKNKENKNKKALKIQGKNLSESNMSEIEKKKLDRMNKLVENAVVYEMRKNQIETEKKPISLKEKISFRKKGYLESNGIETSWTIDEVQEYDMNEKNNDKNKEKNDGKEKEEKKEKEKNDNINNNEEKKDFKLKLLKKPKTEINSNSHTINVNSSNYVNNNLINSNEEDQLTLDITKKRKRILKPKVNQFEFIQKIQKEKKKLPYHIETSNHNKRQHNKNLSTSSKINDSFRHKSASYKKSENNKINSSENNIFDMNDSKQKKYPTIQFQEKETENSEDFPFAKKKNYRKPEELNEFMRKKKIKNRKEEEHKEYEKKKKLFEIFKNLSNLKDSYNSNNITCVNNSISIFKKRNKQNALRHKEINAYYIGTDSSRNGSTILDLNEYYLNILESQQLLINSGYNRINDLSLNINNDENNKNEDIYMEPNNNAFHNNFIYGNYNNEELKQINNILKNNNNENNPTDIIDDNKKNIKINDTMNKVNDIISEKAIDNNININYESNNNDKKKDNDGQNINKTNNFEKKKDRKLEDIKLDNIDNKDNKDNKINNSTSEMNTKEKDLPSLRHTFSNNSNPNKRVEIEIQPCAVLNLVEILKLLYQRKVFYRLCKLYTNHSNSQRYIIAFSYFVAICKQFPFKTIEDYCNYKTYYYAFRQLFRPFIRKNFKKFLNNWISITKMYYFVASLSRMFRFKSLERIYIYSQYVEENEQLKSICGIILKSITTLIKPHLIQNFREFNNRIKKLDKKNKEKEKEIEKPNLNIDIDIDTFEFGTFFNKKKNNSNRINSYLYESFDSKSNYSIHPNSVDNDILHRIQNYLMDNNKHNNKIEKNKINKKLKDDFLCEEDSNKSQDNLHHPKRNNNIKINFLNPQKINEIKKNNNKKQNNDGEIKNKNNLKLDIKKEDTNEFSPINQNINLNKNNEKKIKIEKIKIIKSNNNNSNSESNKDKEKDKEKNNELNNIIKADEMHEEKDDAKDKNNLNEIKRNKEDKKEKEKESFIEKPIESDISAERDVSNNILWELALTPSNSENENMSKDLIKDNNINSNKDINKNSEEKIIQDEKEKENPKKEEKIKEENVKEKDIKDLEKEKDNKGEKNDKKPEEEKNKNSNVENNSNKKDKEDKNIKEENDENFEFDDILLSDLGENSKSLRGDKKKDDKIVNIKKNQSNEEDNINNKKKDVTLVLNRYEFQIQEEKNDYMNIPKKADQKKQISKKSPDDLTEEIIKELIETEIIKKNDNLLPKKSFKNEKFAVNFSNTLLNNSGSVSFKENALKEGTVPTQNSFQSSSFPNFYLNESIMSSISASSIFNRTIKDKKKGKSLCLYLKKIAPILIKFIQEEIYIKYPRIYENISIPLKNNSKEIMVALELQNGEMIRNNYKINCNKEDIKNIIDKEKILKKIEPINKEIRMKDNIFDDNYYDKMLNECIIDSAIEIIKKEKQYGDDGVPLPWGGRTRELLFKYEKDKPKKLIDYVSGQLIDIINTKIGLINTNYEYLTQEQLNIEKEKRLIKTLKDELKENEEHWNNLEIEETQLKIEITEIINEQLYNEVMEILEHIALSRKKPELYQNKSIFVCEEIPKLSFQQNTTDNKGSGFNGEENDLINMD